MVLIADFDALTYQSTGFGGTQNAWLRNSISQIQMDEPLGQVSGVMTAAGDGGTYISGATLMLGSARESTVELTDFFTAKCCHRSISGILF